MIYLSFFTTTSTHRPTQHRQPTKEKQNVSFNFRKKTKCQCILLSKKRGKLQFGKNWFSQVFKYIPWERSGYPCITNLPLDWRILVYPKRISTPNHSQFSGPSDILPCTHIHHHFPNYWHLWWGPFGQLVTVSIQFRKCLQTTLSNKRIEFWFFVHQFNRKWWFTSR